MCGNTYFLYGLLLSKIDARLKKFYLQNMKTFNSTLYSVHVVKLYYTSDIYNGNSNELSELYISNIFYEQIHILYNFCYQKLTGQQKIYLILKRTLIYLCIIPVHVITYTLIYGVNILLSVGSTDILLKYQIMSTYIYFI